MSAAESKKIVLDFVDALSRGDIDAVTGAFADDASWWMPGSLPVSGTYTGVKAILEDFFGTALPYFEPDSLTIKVQSAIAEDNAVAVEWSRTTHEQPVYTHYLDRLTELVWEFCGCSSTVR